METRHYWEENGHGVKYENYNSNDGFGRGGGAGAGAGAGPGAGATGLGCSDQLNFNAVPSEDEDYQSGFTKKGKVSRQQDPLSHRIIEKRRRDRMNNCLADLSRLIPPDYLKKGRGRVEKTEIIEMAIRHLKFLQERVNGLYNEVQGKSDYGSERSAVSEGESYRAGYQQAVGEAVRFLVEVQGFGPREGLCTQLVAHMQRHCDIITKADSPHEKPRHAGSSENASSPSSSSHSYGMKAAVIAVATTVPEPRYMDYEQTEQAPAYNMESSSKISPPPEEDASTQEPLPLDGRRLRAVRKDHDDYLHSYKFKNSIERRFSRSQDCEVRDMSVHPAPQTAHQNKVFTHKRRRQTKPPASNCTSTSNPASTSNSNSGSTEDGTSARDTSPQDTSSDSPQPHRHFEQKPPSTQLVPVFALNSHGKYYVPLSVEYGCLSRHLSSYDVLDARAAHAAAALHPVTIHVNFQPCLPYHVKREDPERDWRV